VNWHAHEQEVITGASITFNQAHRSPSDPSLFKPPSFQDRANQMVVDLVKLRCSGERVERFDILPG